MTFALALEVGGAEGQTQQGVDKQGCCQVDEEIDDMIAHDLQPAVMVIKGKGQNADKPACIKVALGSSEETVQTPDGVILLDKKIIVQNEGHMKAVAIDDDAGKQNEQSRRKRPFAKGIQI